MELNQHCILNILLCLHFRSPLGCYSCYLDGFYGVCYAHWLHQNKWLSRELDYKTVLSVDAVVRVFCEPVLFFFFFFLSEVIIIPWVSAVPFIRGRPEVSGGFWNAWDLRLILTEWPTAFCLLVWRDTPQPLWSPQPRKMQLWFRWPGSLKCLSQGHVRLHAEDRLKTPTKCQVSYSVLYMCSMSVNQIATRNGSLSKPDVLATSREVLHKQNWAWTGHILAIQWCHCRRREQAGTMALVSKADHIKATFCCNQLPGMVLNSTWNKETARESPWT